jgi:hypothetical protein
MTSKKIILSVFILALLAVSIQTANAQGKGYDKIVKHLETNYQAKKVKIPFMWLAKIAVKVVRPAGVKSFNVTLFENLTFSRATLDQEMQSAMNDSLGADWSPMIRIRSREGEQVYMYMREEGENVRVMFVAIDKANATVVRAKFNADKFIEFLNNPRIMGIKIGNGKQEETKPEETKPTENRK